MTAFFDAAGNAASCSFSVCVEQLEKDQCQKFSIAGDTASLPIEDGSYAVTVKASDKSGNSATATRHVGFQAKCKVCGDRDGKRKSGDCDSCLDRCPRRLRQRLRLHQEIVSAPRGAGRRPRG